MIRSAGEKVLALHNSIWPSRSTPETCSSEFEKVLFARLEARGAVFVKATSCNCKVQSVMVKESVASPADRLTAFPPAFSKAHV